MDGPIKTDHIQRAQSVDDYAQAIRLAAQPLLEKGYIQAQYIEEILISIKKNGPYIVVADYVALPHAQPSELVLKTGLSLLLLNEPVDLEGNSIHVFIVLAAKDNHAHLDLLKSLALFLMEKENIMTLISSKSVTEIQDVLKERWVIE